MKETADARVSKVAEGQAGSLARAQALESGLTDSMIRHRLAAQRWRKVRPGVYVLNGTPCSWLQDVWVAVLTVGARAVVTHETALLLHGVPDDELPRYPITLTAPGGHHHRIKGAVVYQRDDLETHHLQEIHGLVVSRPARAIVDLAVKVGQRRLGDLLDGLVVGRCTNLVEVSVCLADVARPGKRGIEKLGKVLDSRGAGYTPPQSELEERFFAALAAAHLPAPVRQFPLPGRGAIRGFVDAAYPDAMLLLEVDGRRWHARNRDMRRDRERDAQASRAGWVTLRFVYEQLVAAPEEVAATVAEVRATRLAQLNPRAA